MSQLSRYVTTPYLARLRPLIIQSSRTLDEEIKKLHRIGEHSAAFDEKDYNHIAKFFQRIEEASVQLEVCAMRVYSVFTRVL